MEVTSLVSLHLPSVQYNTYTWEWTAGVIKNLGADFLAGRAVCVVYSALMSKWCTWSVASITVAMTAASQVSAHLGTTSPVRDQRADDLIEILHIATHLPLNGHQVDHQLLVVGAAGVNHQWEKVLRQNMAKYCKSEDGGLKFLGNIFKTDSGQISPARSASEGKWYR